MSTELRDLLGALTTYDSYRDKVPFSDDFAFIHSHIFEPQSTEYIKGFVRTEDIAEALRLWVQGRGGSPNQPCVFGSIAAAAQSGTSLSNLHFSIITHEDILTKSDQQLTELIASDRLDWKRRSLMWGPSTSTPAHGFILAVISPRLTYAAPDEHLRRFAEKVLALWGVTESHGQSGRMHFETLYLRKPDDGSYVRFTFGVDYFQAQGDGRWYHDHRIPGGIAFTANSVGHMRRYREWYKESKDQEAWVLKRAMQAIYNAADTKWGPATWLKELSSDGKPYVQDVRCPFSTISDSEKPYLEGKDWTKYAGHLHTDHSIRPEFFQSNPAKSPSVTKKEHIQDFTYLYDNRERDYVRFVLGETVAEFDVFDEVGDPRNWTSVVGPRRRGMLGFTEVLSGADPKVKSFLEQCKEKWGIPQGGPASPASPDVDG